MVSMPPIFVISLKSSIRRESISNRLNGLGLKFNFFDAVYGRDLSQEFLSEVDREFPISRFNTKKPLTLGEIGCAMSHINAYHYIVNNNIDRAIILEDDAIVSQEFEAIVKDSLKKVSSKMEILFYEHGKAKSYFWKKNLVERYKLVRYRTPSKNSKRAINRTTAYLITLNGAKKLLEYAYPIRLPADYLTGALQITKIKAYGIEPPCVFLGTDSEIDNIENRS